jgi:hypothetical protein
LDRADSFTDFVLGWGQDANGEIYLLANATGIPFGSSGIVYRVSPPLTNPGNDEGGDDGGGGGGGGCFIATAAYGSYLDPHVKTLRRFRDQYLLTNYPGEWFVEYYYQHSPPIADYIRERETLRTMVRSLLIVVVYSIEYPVAAFLVVLLPPLIVARKRKRRKDRVL